MHLRLAPPSPASIVVNLFTYSHFPCDSVKKHRQCRCSRSKIIAEGTVSTIVKIPFALCFCPLYIACLGPFYVKQFYENVRDYEAPKKRRRKAKERIVQDIAKKIPRILAPRIGDEVFLTIGKEDEDIERAEIENGKGMEGGKETLKGGIRTDAQKNCILFRLPPELRREIWIEALGGYLFRLSPMEAYKRFALTRCKHEFGDVTCYADQCRLLMKQKGAKDKYGNVELLSLLKTCRRIYAETVDILYNENTFCFKSLGDVMKFSLQVNPQRMIAMKNVRWGTTDHDDRDERYSTNRPWLKCEAPEACECIECWGRLVSLAVNLDCEYLATVQLAFMR